MQKHAKILVVEDDADINHLIAVFKNDAPWQLVEKMGHKIFAELTSGELSIIIQWRINSVYTT